MIFFHDFRSLFKEISKIWDRGISRSPGLFFTTDTLSADNITGVFIKNSMLPGLSGKRLVI